MNKSKFLWATVLSFAQQQNLNKLMINQARLSSSRETNKLNPKLKLISAKGQAWNMTQKNKVVTGFSETVTSFAPTNKP